MDNIIAVIIFGVIVFAISVVLLRWILGINLIHKELKENNKLMKEFLNRLEG